ncbi:hypothetical protein BGM09_15720 [Streptomyces sp. CBMA29]|nr:hypothetical protein [Streptomyces sp. CBMA29]
MPQSRTVVVLSFPGYQEVEFWYPAFRAREAGADLHLVTSDPEGCESHLGYPVVPTATVEQLAGLTIDALVVPGGVGAVPVASAGQRALIGDFSVRHGHLVSSGTGTDLVRSLLGPGFTSPNWLTAPDADGLPELYRELFGRWSRK